LRRPEFRGQEMKSRCYITALFFCALFSTGTIYAATVNYQPPNLTISANDEPLISVLRAIAKEMNISISYASNIDKAVTCRIEKLPVQRAFKNLLDNSNFALQWEDKRVVGLAILPQGKAQTRTNIIPAGHENMDTSDSSEMDREIANETARIENEVAAEESRIEQEMMKGE